jgi:hypothetical protein
MSMDSTTIRASGGHRFYDPFQKLNAKEVKIQKLEKQLAE